MKRIVILGGVAAAALALSACGKKEEAPAAEATADEPEMMAAETPAAEGTGMSAEDAAAEQEAAAAATGTDQNNNPIGPAAGPAAGAE